MLELDTSKHDLFLGQKAASSLSYLSLDGCQDFPSREGKQEKDRQKEPSRQRCRGGKTWSSLGQREPGVSRAVVSGMAGDAGIR